MLKKTSKKNNFDKYLEYEEMFLKNKKKYRKQRKIKSSKDRSKYKKTDIKKQKNIKKRQTINLEKARVLSILGEEILVGFNKKQIKCTLRGILKKEKTKNKNIIAVGDIVNIDLQGKDQGVIHSIDRRYSILSRGHEIRKKKSIIAVNIDQVFITTSICQPHLKPHLVDRYMIACEMGNMTPLIIINKIDLLNKSKKQKQLYKDFLKIYKDLGYLVLSISCKKNLGLKSLKKQMRKKTSVFSGQSGTGKSTIINAILHTKFKTGKVIKKTYKGAHITSKAQLVEIKGGGFCIDTPGIKSFSIWDLTIKDVKNHFF